MQKYTPLFLSFLIGITLWFIPPLEGITLQGWHLFSIFIATIFAIVFNALPMGVAALTALFALVITHTLTFHEAFNGFSNHVVWLIVFAFFIARGFIKTGLGSRISYLFMYFLGKKTLGLGYGLAAADFILSSSIPSSTARSGGVILPIVESLSESFDSKGHSPSANRMGGYLALVGFHTSCISSAMFITAMAVNPLIVEIASGMGVHLTWASWAIAAFIPGILSLIAIPLLIYAIHPPEIHFTPDAQVFAKAKLNAMGKIKREEWIMIATFFLLIGLWIAGPYIHLEATVTALFGLVILMLSNILTWKEIRSEEGAWETLIWFGVLLTMAGYLQQFGVTAVIGSKLIPLVEQMHWTSGFLIIGFFYFYSHYFFASILAHVSAMYAAFLALAIQIGAPPYLAALVLGYFSSLFGCLTQYSCGPAALLFGAGYVSAKNWWKVGFIVSVANIAIWVIFGGLWWKILGLW